MSTAHISDDLPRLLTGDATREEVMAAAAHLRSCIDCQQELVSATVAHASLASAQRFAPEVVAHRPQDVSPAELPSAELPDLSAVFAQVRQEVAEESTAPKTGGRIETESRAGGNRSGRTRLAVAAVAAGVLIGGGGAFAVSHLGGSSSPSGQRVALAAFGVGKQAASARMSGGTMTIDATSLPAPDATHRYEVWLTNPTRTQMQPVGWIGTNGKATLTVPSDLVQSYSAIEVSVQDVRAPSYDFSGTSVLRGKYSA
jgi:hypothetical protein